MRSFSGKRVLVTGGSSGIGLAAAKIVAQEGAHVALVARNAERLRAAREEVAKVAAEGSRIEVFSLDVTDPDASAVTVKQVIEALGGLDVLILNAGYARCGAVEKQPLHEFRALMDTNFMGHLHIVQAAAAHLKAQRSGSICLVTSMLGFMSTYGYAAYSASKYAIVGFAEGLRQEMLPYGVHVGVFYPPTTDTPGLATENESKPELTWQIEGSSRQFTSEQVAYALLRGVRRRWFTNMVGFDSWAIYYLSRWAPGLVRWVIDRPVRAWVKEKGLNL